MKRFLNTCLPGDYIAYKFSGEMTTTINGLSEGTIWDFKSQEVAQWLFDYYNIDSSMTPTIVPNFVTQCLVNKKGAEESGLKEGTPLHIALETNPIMLSRCMLSIQEKLLQLAAHLGWCMH